MCQVKIATLTVSLGPRKLEMLIDNHGYLQKMVLHPTLLCCWCCKKSQEPIDSKTAQPGAVMLDVGSQDHPAALQPWRNIQRSMVGWQVSTTNGCRRAPQKNQTKKHSNCTKLHKTGELMMNFSDTGGLWWIMVNPFVQLATCQLVTCCHDFVFWRAKNPQVLGFLARSTVMMTVLQVASPTPLATNRCSVLPLVTVLRWY